MDDLTKSLLDDVRMEDLSGESVEMAAQLGLESFKNLVCHFGGSNPYIPRLESIIIKARNRKIRKEYDGTNARQLGRKYGISERYIRSTLSDK